MRTKFTHASPNIAMPHRRSTCPPPLRWQSRLYADNKASTLLEVKGLAVIMFWHLWISLVSVLKIKNVTSDFT